MKYIVKNRDKHYVVKATSIIDAVKKVKKLNDTKYLGTSHDGTDYFYKNGHFYANDKKIKDENIVKAMRDADELSDVQMKELDKILRKLDKYALYVLAYDDYPDFNITGPKSDIFDDAEVELSKKSVEEINKLFKELHINAQLHDSVMRDEKKVRITFTPGQYDTK